MHIPLSTGSHDTSTMPASMYILVHIIMCDRPFVQCAECMVDRGGSVQVPASPTLQSADQDRVLFRRPVKELAKKCKIHAHAYMYNDYSPV